MALFLIYSVGGFVTYDRSCTTIITKFTHMANCSTYKIKLYVLRHRGFEQFLIQKMWQLTQVQYGGRVTDDFDKRLLCTVTNVWFTDQLLRPGFSFYDGKEIFLDDFWPKCTSGTPGVFTI